MQQPLNTKRFIEKKRKNTANNSNKADAKFWCCPFEVRGNFDDSKTSAASIKKQKINNNNKQ